MTNDQIIIARRMAGKTFAAASQTEPPVKTVTETVQGLELRVTVIIEPVRYEPARPTAQEQAREMSEATGLRIMPLGRPDPPAEPAHIVDLKTIHHRVISKLTRLPVSLKTLARLCILSPKSGHFRTAVSDLVRWKLIVKSPEGYSLP